MCCAFSFLKLGYSNQLRGSFKLTKTENLRYLLNSKTVFLDWGKNHTLFEKVLFTHLYKNDMAAFLTSTVIAHFLLCTFEIFF